jgi:hypothetical protein
VFNKIWREGGAVIFFDEIVSEKKKSIGSKEDGSFIYKGVAPLVAEKI